LQATERWTNAQPGHRMRHCSPCSLRCTHIKTQTTLPSLAKCRHTAWSHNNRATGGVLAWMCRRLTPLTVTLPMQCTALCTQASTSWGTKHHIHQSHTCTLAHSTTNNFHAAPFPLSVIIARCCHTALHNAVTKHLIPLPHRMPLPPFTLQIPG